mgnify:CR=1 FL=1
MQLTQREKDAISCLIHHAIEDIGYAEGGSYVDRNNTDQADSLQIKKAWKAIEILHGIIKNN